MGVPPWRRWGQITDGVIRPGGLALTERALAFCGLPTGAVVLDVGCGLGATIEVLAQRGLAAIGVDPSAELLRSAREQHTSGLYVRATGERLPLASGTMDAVLAECSLSVIKDADRAVAEFSRVLKPGGKLVVSDIYLRRPEFAPALRCLSLAGCLGGACSREELADRLARHGLLVVQWEDHSAAYRQFAAQLLMAGGSLEQLWSRAEGVDCRTDCSNVQRMISAAKPGYFLLVAERQSFAPPGPVDEHPKDLSGSEAAPIRRNHES